MSYPLIFKLKQEPGFFDATGFCDRDLISVPEDTVCLSLENANISDEGISNLPTMTKLRCIDLDSTGITDRSMEVISRFGSLEEVWIEGARITDVGFKKFTLLPKLRYISFWDCQVSEDAVKYLEYVLPDLKLEG